MRGYAAIGLVAPKCDQNVGGALRAAMCYGASMIAIEGGRYERRAEAKRTDTSAAYRHIPVLQGSLRDLVPHKCVPVAVEFTEAARSLVNYVHPERGFYIFGPEDGSVPPEILEWCNGVIKVPTNFCMNLAATVNVVLYDRLAKQQSGKTPTPTEKRTADSAPPSPLSDWNSAMDRWKEKGGERPSDPEIPPKDHL